MNNESQLIRDTLQTHLLHSIFKQNVRDALAIKGGMAMKTVFGVARLTKDIDLEASTDVPIEFFRNLVDKAIKESLLTGLVTNPTVTKPKMTETTSRWKINGTTPDGAPLNLTLEMSRRRLLDSDTASWTTIKPLSDLSIFKKGNDEGIPVLSYTPQALATTKVHCLTDDIRTAPRDLYDLSVIITTTMEPPIHLLAESEPEELERQIQNLWAKIEVMDWDLFKNEVIPHLTLSEQERITPDTYETMRITVGNTVESWLNHAKTYKQEPMKKGIL